MEKQYKADEFRRYTKAQLRQHLEELEAHVDTSPKLPKDHFVQACMEQSKVGLEARHDHLQKKRVKEFLQTKSRSYNDFGIGSMDRAVNRLREQRRGRESVPDSLPASTSSRNEGDRAGTRRNRSPSEEEASERLISKPR